MKVWCNMEIYNENTTMQFLAKQVPLLVTIVQKYRKQFEDLCKAHYKHTIKSEDIISDIGLDFFLLGYTMGKRENRNRRKK